MKILFLQYSDYSGSNRHLSNALSRQGCEITPLFVTEKFRYRMRRYKLPSFAPHNIFNIIIALLQYKMYWKKYFLRTDFAFDYMSNIAKNYIKKNQKKFDVVLQGGVLFGILNKKKCSLPYGLYLDHTYALSKKYLIEKGILDSCCASAQWEHKEQEVYHTVDIIFTMSNSVKNSLIYDYRIPSEKIVVVGAGPNLPLIPEKTQNERHKDSSTILFIGKDFIRKGGETLLKAFSLVRKKIPHAKLIIAGPSRGIIQEGVIWKGPIASECISELYKNACLFVMPTLREPFGIVYLEAMAYGLPCIGTDIEAVPEIIQDNETGFIVPARDEKILAEKIILLLKNHALRECMGQKGYTRVQSYFNWDQTAHRIYTVLNSYTSHTTHGAPRASPRYLCLPP